LRVPSKLRIGQPQIVVCLGRPWPESYCLLEHDYCFAKPASLDQRQAKIVIRLAVTGPKRNGLLVAGDGVFFAAQRAERVAEVVARFGVVRSQPQCFFQTLGAFFRLAKVYERDAEIVVGRGMVGLDLYSLAEYDGGLRSPAVINQGKPLLIQGFRLGDREAVADRGEVYRSY